MLRLGDVLDVQIKLQDVPAHDVRGVLLNPDGTPAAKVAITLAEDLPPAEGTRTVSDGEGAFEFKGVADWEWYLWAAREMLRAGTWISVAGQDIERVKLRLAAPFTVWGRVVTEAPDGTPALQAPLVSVIPHAGSGRREWGRLLNFMLMTPPPGNSLASKAQQRMVRSFLLNEELAISAEPDAAGNFSLPDFDAGGYRIVAMAAPPP